MRVSAVTTLLLLLVLAGCANWTSGPNGEKGLDSQQPCAEGSDCDQDQDRDRTQDRDQDDDADQDRDRDRDRDESDGGGRR